MKSITCAAVLLAAIAFVLPTTVRAQTQDEPTKLNIRMGMFRPSDSLTQTLTGDTWSWVQVLYDLKRDENVHPKTQVHLGLLESADTDDSAISLGVDKLWWQKPEGNSLYYGAGLSFAKFNIAGERNLTAMGELFLGYNIGDSFFVEARGLIVPTMSIFSTDIKMSGAMLSIGTRKLF